MWVFDGEEWLQEGKSTNVESPREKKQPEVPYELFLPELAVYEVPFKREEERYLPTPRI